MIKIIAALSEDRTLAKDGKLPWKLPKELKNFYHLVKKTLIICGYKTFEAMGGVVKGASEQWVLTRKHASIEDLSKVSAASNRVHFKVLNTAKKLTIFSSLTKLKKAVKVASNKGLDVSVIGGEEVFKEFLSLADEMNLTIIKGKYTGNVHFPAVDLAKWRLVQLEERYEGKTRYQLTIWRRVQ